MKPRVVIVIVLGVISLATIIGYQALKSSKSVKQNSDSSTSSQYSNYSSQYNSSSPSTRSNLSTTPTSSGEQLNSPGKRRPPQYLHICDTPDGSIEYVSQGNPKCLGNDVYQRDYDTSVPGTVFSSPCKTNSGTLRYVYISNDESCPSGTTLIFYNSLGGSTSTQ